MEGQEPESPHSKLPLQRTTSLGVVAPQAIVRVDEDVMVVRREVSMDVRVLVAAVRVVEMVETGAPMQEHAEVTRAAGYEFPQSVKHLGGAMADLFATGTPWPLITAASVTGMTIVLVMRTVMPSVCVLAMTEVVRV